GKSNHWQAFYDEERPCLVDLLLDNDQALLSYYYDNIKKSSLTENGVESMGPLKKLNIFCFSLACQIKDSNGNVIGALETIDDITDLVKVENDLKEERNLFIGGNTVVIKWKNEPHWPVEYIAPNCEAQFGYKPADFLSGAITLSSIIHPEDFSQIAFEVEGYCNGDTTCFEQEYRIQHANGEYRWVYDFTILVRDTTSHVSHFHGYFNDITARKLAEFALQKSEEMYRMLIDTANESICITDGNETITFVNSRMTRLLGYSSDELTGKPFYSFFYPEDIQEYREKINHFVALHGGQYECRLQAKDLKQVWTLISISPIHGGSGEYAGSISMLADITRLKITEEALRDSEESYRALYENNPTMYITVDTNAIIRSVNRFGCEEFGYEENELVNSSMLKLFHEDDQQSALLYINKCLVNMGRVMNWELRKVRKDGVVLWVREAARALVDQNGEVIIFIVCDDITAKKELELERKEALERAKESDKLKSVLLANMSHELRTPINGILGFANILLEESVDPNSSKMLRKIIYSGKRLLNTLNSVMILSQIESRSIPVNIRQVPLAEVTKTNIRGLMQEASDRNLRFNLVIHSGNVMCYLDEQLLNRLLFYIIDNSIKFTKEGSITVTVSQTIKENVNYGCLMITDTGIGMTTEEQEVIFREFKQASEGYDRKYEGLGLGLTISKKLIDILQGQIEIQSKLGEGTSVCLYFPAASAPAPAVIASEYIPKIGESKLQNVKILLVEDNSINADVCIRYLSDYQVDYAPDASTAINMAKNQQYSLILLDINLSSEMNGIQALQSIRSIEGYESIPVVAVTGYAMIGDKDQFKTVGFDNYLAKPYKRSELLEIVETMLAQSE
ncbi:MAG: PAS domain S-box protein, partial [Ignavibacteria bacterium]|nr:PAS domain S-box protein [Ignavibacteria bacterium]